jgi:hypothetical protein
VRCGPYRPERVTPRLGVTCQGARFVDTRRPRPERSAGSGRPPGGDVLLTSGGIPSRSPCVIRCAARISPPAFRRGSTNSFLCQLSTRPDGSAGSRQQVDPTGWHRRNRPRPHRFAGARAPIPLPGRKGGRTAAIAPKIPHIRAWIHHFTAFRQPAEIIWHRSLAAASPIRIDAAVGWIVYCVLGPTVRDCPYSAPVPPADGAGRRAFALTDPGSFPTTFLAPACRAAPPTSCPAGGGRCLDRRPVLRRYGVRARDRSRRRVGSELEGDSGWCSTATAFRTSSSD